MQVYYIRTHHLTYILPLRYIASPFAYFSINPHLGTYRTDLFASSGKYDERAK